MCSNAVEHTASTMSAPYAGMQSPKLDGWNLASHRNDRANERRTHDARLIYFEVKACSYCELPGH